MKYLQVFCNLLGVGWDLFEFFLIIKERYKIKQIYIMRRLGKIFKNSFAQFFLEIYLELVYECSIKNWNQSFQFHQEIQKFKLLIESKKQLITPRVSPSLGLLNSGLKFSKLCDWAWIKLLKKLNIEFEP